MGIVIRHAGTVNVIDLELANQAGVLFRKQIEAEGYSISISSDFELLAHQAAIFSHEITPHFEPKQNTFFRSEAFWLGVYDKKGRCVGYAAAKKQPVGREGLIGYLQRYWSRVYREGSSTEIKFSEWQLEPLQRIVGNLIYAGAWYIKPKLHSTGLGKNLGKYLICYAFMEWRETDYFYIFMENKDVRSGLAAALELKDQVPNAIQWDSHPSQAKPNYWLLGSSKDDFQAWAKAQIRLNY